MVNQPQLVEANHHLVLGMQKHDVRFLVIGARAMLAHGITRDTADLDLWLSPTREDAERLATLFAKAQPHFSFEQWVAHIHRPNVRMAYPHDYAKEADILTSIAGADFEAAYQRRVVGKFGGLALPVVGLEDLIELKKISHASGNVPEAKARDAADLELLAKLGKPAAS